MFQLSDLAVGEKAMIKGYLACDPAYRRKLLRMGLTPGAEIELLGVAPLGDPIRVLSRGLSLCLRKKEAAVLTLEKK